MAATKGFWNNLSSAVCEWFLMLLMFIDAALAYFLTKFACFCKLQSPCLFCLRLDHLFGEEEHESYLNLFCINHRDKVSSLISCNLHSKLADVREMCEDCFLSLSKRNQSYLNKNFVRVPSSNGACSCCKRQWKVKSSAQRLIEPSNIGLGASKVTVKPPLPRVCGCSRFSRKDSFKKVRDKISGTMSSDRNNNNIGADVMSHVGYSELKITSDSESEVPFSDDDDASSVTDFHKVIGEKRGSLENQEKLKRQVDSSTDIRTDISVSSDKNDGCESLDGSTMSEIEGEGVVEKLKRQVEDYKKDMNVLQSELEEERNASEIAANEAMAMITRLQEEKAALHMEALQYLRMMEEQAQYDMEALQRANDLVTDKEKEIQDLEYELELYKDRFDEELMMENGNENGKIDANSFSDSKPVKVVDSNGTILDLEDEKKYILQCLSDLEMKFNQFSDVENIENKDLSTSNGSPSTNDISVENKNRIENEISDLNERLEALETDRDFLEHACNALHNGDGFQFIREIATELKDLRRIMFDRRCLSNT